MNRVRRSRPPIGSLARPLLRLALGGCLALAALVLAPRVLYLTALASAPDLRARGELAADENTSPFVTAGQVRWRRELARRAREGNARPSGLALAWGFFTDPRNQPPRGSRVLLTRANDALYQSGNFHWYPARLEVAPDVTVPLADGDDLRRAAAGRDCTERDWLRRHGYAGCVTADGSALRLVPLDRTP